MDVDDIKGHASNQEEFEDGQEVSDINVVEKEK